MFILIRTETFSFVNKILFRDIFTCKSQIIIYVWSVGILKNFLAPTMQIYLKVSVFVLIIIGLNLLASENNEHNFKKSNLILLLPVLMLIFAGNGRLTTNFAKNRVSNYTKTTSKKEIETTIEKEEKIEEEVEEIEEPIDISNYDFSKPDFEVVDENYNNLGATEYGVSFYDTEWNKMQVSYGKHKTPDVSRPIHLNEMIRIATTLSKEFPFIRVDFFETCTKIYVAELTLYPGGGLTPYHPESINLEMGELFILSE